MSGDRCERCGKELSYREDVEGFAQFASGNRARLCNPCHDAIVKAMQTSPQWAAKGRVESDMAILQALAISGRDTRQEMMEAADRVLALKRELFDLVESLLSARTAAPATAES